MNRVSAARRLDERQLLAALRAFHAGDFSARLPSGLSGIDGEIAATFNDVIQLGGALTKEIGRLGKVVGKQGRTNQRARLPRVGGAWRANIEALNTLVSDISNPTVEIARVI